jgi:hypothetical protein
LTGTLTEMVTDLASTTIAATADAPAAGTTETWTVASSAAFPAITAAVSQFHVTDPAALTEIIAVTAVSGTTWTVTRGAEGTTPVTHAAGYTVKLVLTANVINAMTRAYQSLLVAPAGAIAETMPRNMVTATKTAGATGTLYLNAIGLPLNAVVSTITMMTGATPETGGSHGWYALLDSGGTVRAVTADQTGTAAWAANTDVGFAVGTAYTTTYTGLHYVGVCITASGMPTFTGAAALVNVATIAPQLLGGVAALFSTPPAVGSALPALTTANVSSNITNFYAYLT